VASIVGLGVTPVGIVPDLGATQLYAMAIREAVGDAGRELPDIDLLITGNSRAEPFMYHAQAIAEYLGITPERCATFDTGGSTTLTAIAFAKAMVETGEAHTAVIAMADSLASGLGRSTAIQTMATVAHPLYEQANSPSIPSLYAQLATRYMYEFGVSAEDIAAVAVSDRAYAAMNEEAQFRDLITVQDVLESRLIADPLHLLDCSPVSDGGCAIVISAPRDHNSAGPASVAILGSANASNYEHISQAPSYTSTAASHTSKLALERAGRSLSDIDIAMIYDAFSFMMCMTLESIGVCGEGEGGSFVASGETGLKGALPTNTHGGVLSHSHAGRPSGLFLVVEAMRQLRADCGPRQVDCQTALVHCSGGIASSHGTMIFGKEA
jgi:acetyl-CoA acetyltransferase